MRSAFPIPPPITSEAAWTAPGQEDGAGTNADFGPVESRATEGAGHRAVVEDAVDGAVGPAVLVDAPVGHVVAMLEELPESEEEREEHDEAERPRQRVLPDHVEATAGSLARHAGPADHRGLDAGMRARSVEAAPLTRKTARE
jgi:hypothetical protein